LELSQRNCLKERLERAKNLGVRPNESDENLGASFG